MRRRGIAAGALGKAGIDGMAEVWGALGSMLSLIVVTALGYVAARFGFLTAEIRPKLSGLIFNITLPCTVLASVGQVDSSLGGGDITWSFVLGAAIFFMMLLAGVPFFFYRLTGARKQEIHEAVLKNRAAELKAKGEQAPENNAAFVSPPKDTE